jgi:pyruvate formate lyase activating enzyme
MSIEELTAQLLKDQVFYEVSGGGVTFSGGEPALQSHFMKMAARELKQRKIHIALDTCGNVPWENLQELLEVVDLVLYDIKFTDNGKHRRFTGESNETIKRNAKHLSDAGIPLIIRFPLLPGINDNNEDIEGLVQFVEGLHNVKQVDILPYHKLGVGKYIMLDKEYRLSPLDPPDKDHIARIKRFIEARGFKAAVGG